MFIATKDSGNYSVLNVGLLCLFLCPSEVLYISLTTV